MLMLMLMMLLMMMMEIIFSLSLSHNHSKQLIAAINSKVTRARVFSFSSALEFTFPFGSLILLVAC